MAKITEVTAGVNLEQLQHALGRADYTTDEVLAEFIDNSISASRPNIPVSINISLDGDLLTYDDNGTGIDRDRLENALSLGSYQTLNPVDGMNEHGLGFKQAMFRLGKFLSLESFNQLKDTYTIKGKADFRYGLALNESMQLDDKSSLTTPGILFKIQLTPNMQQEFKDKSKLAELADRLGAKYQDLLKANKLEINFDVDGRHLNISPRSPQMWNFKTGKAGALLDKIYKGDDGSWEARIVMGYTPDPGKHEKVYAEQKWTPIEPQLKYSRSNTHSGFDLKVGLRVIEHSAKKLSKSMGLRELLIRDHDDTNGIHGTIHFIKGFKTQPTKNRMEVTDSLKELYAKANADTREIAYDVKTYEQSLKHRNTPVAVMAGILKAAKIHKKRARSVVEVSPELYAKTDIIHAVVDKTSNTLYIETKHSNPDKAQLVTIHDVAMQRIVEPNPLDLKKQINRIITVVKGAPSAPLAKFAAMLPMFTKLTEEYDVEIKHNELMTPAELELHLSESLNFK